MPTADDVSNADLKRRSGVGLAAGAGLGLLLDAILGQPGIGLILGAGVGLGLGLAAPRLAARIASWQGIPSDFKIVAGFCGLWGISTTSKLWRCTITADGKVVRGVHPPLTEIEAYEYPAANAPAALSRADLRDLAAKIKEADFYGLPDHLNLWTSSVEDTTGLNLTITQDGRTHSVYVTQHGDWKKCEGAERFLLIWSEVLRKVPSPNPEQTPERYEL